MRRHLLGLLVAVVAYKASLLSIPFVDFQVGRAEARWDAWHGKHYFRRSTGWCVTVDVTRKWELMLEERFGFKTIAVEDNFRLYGYNEFQRGEFDRLFGAGALEREADDFRRQWVREMRSYAKDER